MQRELTNKDIENINKILNFYSVGNTAYGYLGVRTQAREQSRYKKIRELENSLKDKVKIKKIKKGRVYARREIVISNIYSKFLYFKTEECKDMTSNTIYDLPAGIIDYRTITLNGRDILTIKDSSIIESGSFPSILFFGSLTEISALDSEIDFFALSSGYYSSINKIYFTRTFIREISGNFLSDNNNIKWFMDLETSIGNFGRSEYALLRSYPNSDIQKHIFYV